MHPLPALSHQTCSVLPPNRHLMVLCPSSSRGSPPARGSPLHLPESVHSGPAIPTEGQGGLPALPGATLEHSSVPPCSTGSLGPGPRGAALGVGDSGGDGEDA